MDKAQRTSPTASPPASKVRKTTQDHSKAGSSARRAKSTRRSKKTPAMNLKSSSSHEEPVDQFDREKQLIEREKQLKQLTEQLLEREKQLTEREKQLTEKEKQLNKPGSVIGFKVPQCREPKTLSVSASEAKSTHVDPLITEGKIYHHWFAVALYDLRIHLESSANEDNEVEFPFKGIKMSIPRSRLDKVVEQWKFRFDLNELGCTSGLSVELDRFLFPDDDKRLIGSCFHQMPLKHSAERPEFSILPYPINGTGYALEKFVAIADFKKEEIEKAQIESLAYNLKGQKGDHSLVRLVFPCTMATAKLNVTIPVDQRLLSICVCEVDNISDGKQLEIFLCMLYAGVHYLLSNPIKAIGYICPTNDLKLNYLKERESRVFCDEQNVVYKLFDTQRHTPQIEVAKTVLHDAKEIKLSSDGRYTYITYSLRQGVRPSEVTLTDTQVYQLLQQLDAIHQKGFVHSDIRDVNTVVSMQQNKAWIIDFDLADEEGEPYPSSYNNININERHPEARAKKPRLKIHDVYSLSKITRRFCIWEQYNEQGTSLKHIKLYKLDSVTKLMLSNQ